MYAALVYILQAHCVTVVCFIHSWIIRGLMGGCGNDRDATTPFICAPVHPHSPFAVTHVTYPCAACQRHPLPYRHGPMVHSLLWSWSWHLGCRGKKVMALISQRARTSSVVSEQVRKVTFPAVIKCIGLHNNQCSSYKRQQTSSQLSFCCTTGLGCHINIYSKCLLCCSNLWHTGFQQLLLFLCPPLLSLISLLLFMSCNLMGIEWGGRKLDVTPSDHMRCVKLMLLPWLMSAGTALCLHSQYQASNQIVAIDISGRRTWMLPLQLQVMWQT